MRRFFIFSAALTLAPVAVSAQELQPITLSPDEYRAVMSVLAERDPIISLLDGKQRAAMAAAQAHAAQPAPSDKREAK